MRPRRKRRYVLCGGRCLRDGASGDEFMMAENATCRLPSQDRPQRVADFRALFASALIDRQRLSGGVLWRLRASRGIEQESRRLAELERLCCDGVGFEIRRDEDVVVWRMTGPDAAATTIDAFYDLPVLVASDDTVGELWRRLDAGACWNSQDK